MQRDRIKALVREALQRRLEDSPAEPDPGGPQAPRPRDLVCETDVLAARRAGRPVLTGPRAIITPLARETAIRYGVDIVERSPERPAPAPAPASTGAPAPSAAPAPAAADVVALGADHGGFALKETLKRFLEDEAGYVVLDFGTDSAASVDYPEFAHRVAGAVVRGEAARGILIDGMGLGSAMAANRHAGVRAAAVNGIMEALNAREHNDANVLCLGGRMVGDLLARAITMVFLTTGFAGGRHARRVSAIEVS